MRYNIGTTSLRLFTNSLHLFNICLHSLFLLYCTGISVAVPLRQHQRCNIKKSQRFETSLPRSPNCVPLMWGFSFFIDMYRKRHIYLDPKLAGAAVGTKESTEALAVVLGIKVTFVNSVVTNASAIRLMHILRIGHARYKRAVGYALRKGWLVREGDNIRATSIKATDSYNVKLVFKKHYYIKGKRGDDIRCPYTMTNLCNFIREAVLLHHISKQAVVYDTITTATQRPASSKQRTKYNAANERAKSWGMRRLKLRKNADRLSYARISEIAGCSRTKAKSLVKSLVNGGVINKTENYEETKININDFRNEAGRFDFDKFKAFYTDYANNGQRGFIVSRDGQIMLRLANSYTLNRVVVRFVPTKGKQTKTA